MSETTMRTRVLGEALPIAFEDRGRGRPYLILHGGAGPASMARFAAALAGTGRAIVPTHPGFAGEPRPDWFRRIDELALAYLALLDRLDLADVIVIGNSLGGWIAAEMALRASPRVAGIVLLNPVGIDTGSPDKAIFDPMSVPPAERVARSFHDPARFAVLPTTPEALAAMAANQQTLRVYGSAGGFMHDPTLRARLAAVTAPALVIWGESDRIVDAAYGRLFATSMPGARFAPVAEAGHFPHIERSEQVQALIADFVATGPGGP